MNRMKTFLLHGILLTCVNVTALWSQRTATVPGDFIVHTDAGASIHQIVESILTIDGIPTGMRVVRTLCASTQIYLLHADGGLLSDGKILQSLRGIPGVKVAQFNHILDERSLPDDPSFSNQWQWNNKGQTGGKPGADISLLDAWKITTGGTTARGDTIVVAVVDNGINRNHPDFQGNIWFNLHEIPFNGIDDDGNGYIDDVRGWNTSFENDSIYGGSHGTPVSGMIGAKGNNGIGVSGVNWDVKIMVIRPSSTQEALVIAAYSYALAQRKLYHSSNGSKGAFVVAVNSSWGINYGQPADAPIWCAFYDSLGVHGILSTGATANLNIDVDVQGDLPTGCPSDYLISVTSTNSNDNKANAAWGKTTIDLAAPGQGIHTTHNNGDYSNTSGTSFASPTVAGIVGLLYSIPCEALGEDAMNDPSGTALSVKKAILDGVDVLPNLEPILFTGGRANAFKSVKNLLMACMDCPLPFGLQSEETSPKAQLLSWEDCGTAASFEVRYRLEGEDDWTIAQVTTPFLPLSGLEKCATYEWEVRSTCNGADSPWSSSIFNTTDCCPTPLNATLTVVSADSAVMQWQPAQGAMAVNVAYKEKDSMDWTIVADITDNILMLSGLLPCTEYEVEFRSVCVDGNSIEPEVITFITAGCVASCTSLNYCPSNANDSSLEFIEAIKIGTFNNVSGDNNGYGDYTAQSIDLKTWHKYSYTFTPGYPSFAYTENWMAWIDYNQDGDFSSEEVVVGPIATSEPFSGKIKVPGDAIPGSTRMRVMMSFSSILNPCGVFSFGETEDYCVNIIEAEEPCDYPDSLNLTNISETTVFVSWQPVTVSTQYFVSYQIKDSGNWVELATDQPGILLQSLEPCTYYDVRLQVLCDTAYSDFTEVFTFRTKGCGACLDYNYCVKSGSPFTSQWIDEIELDGFVHNTGNNQGYAFYEDLPFKLYTNYDHDLIIRPGTEFSINPNFYRVFIDYTQNGVFTSVELVASADDTNEDEVILTIEVPSGVPAGKTRMRVILQSFSGSNDPCETLFTGEVEDYCVEIIKAPPPCVPRKISIASINQDSVTLTWKEVVPAITYEVQYRIEGTMDWVTVTANTNSLTLEMLEPCTWYEVRMKAYCDMEETEFGPIFRFRTYGCGNCIDITYCESEGNNFDLEFIQSVSLESLFNESGSTAGYTFFEEHTTELDTGKVYTITITPGFNGFQFTENMAAWIDYNRDGIFTTDEQIISAVSDQAVSADFLVPGVELGDTRLRVMLNFSSLIDPCADFSFGEVEDYCITLTPGEIPCIIPENFDTLNVTKTDATIQWDSVQTAIAFIVRYRPLGASNWTIEVPVLEHSYTFTGLEECKEYEVNLTTVCQNKLSDVGSIVFKTECTVSADRPDDVFSGMRIVPNPFTSAPTLHFNCTEPTMAHYAIYDARGSMLHQSGELLFHQGRNERKLTEIDPLPAGVYHLLIRGTSGNVVSQRLVKL